jgi:hypothetical protein
MSAVKWLLEHPEFALSIAVLGARAIFYLRLRLRVRSAGNRRGRMTSRRQGAELIESSDESPPHSHHRSRHGRHNSEGLFNEAE